MDYDAEFVNEIIEEVRRQRFQEVMHKRKESQDGYNDGYMIGYINNALESKLPNIIQVEFNDQTTFVWWDDGTQTQVTCQNEVFDAEKGLAMAIVKKLYGNTSHYNELFRTWIPNNQQNPFINLAKALQSVFANIILK